MDSGNYFLLLNIVNLKGIDFFQQYQELAIWYIQNKFNLTDFTELYLPTEKTSAPWCIFAIRITWIASPLPQTKITHKTTIQKHCCSPLSSFRDLINKFTSAKSFLNTGPAFRRLMTWTSAVLFVVVLLLHPLPCMIVS